MLRVGRGDCPTTQANDVRDLGRSGRVALNPIGGPAGAVYAVEVDGDPVGCVIHAAEGWIGGRLGWVDPHPRSKRHAAVRRLLMSHPRGTFDKTPVASVAGDITEGGTSL